MKKKAKKKDEIRKQLPVKEKLPEQSEPNVEKSFDFGGLPDRNLKKNLGCG